MGSCCLMGKYSVMLKQISYSPITSWQIGGETVETVVDFISLLIYLFIYLFIYFWSPKS